MQVEGWTDFFVASAGATAALAGLVFVSLSINLARILALPTVPARAGETIVLLAGGLFASLLALMPGLSLSTLGALLVCLWLLIWVLPVLNHVRSWRRHYFPFQNLALLRVLLFQVGSLPYLWAALAIRGWCPGGVYALACALILSMTVALCNAWVLLVEILR